MDTAKRTQILPTLNDLQPENGEIIKRLSFGFAKRFGVFIEESTKDSVTIIHHPNVDAQVLIELRRYLQRPLILEEVSEEQFQLLLAKAYETGAEAAAEAIISIEEDIDLGRMIHDLPKIEDLLETEDDAPIIRLINAILTQAIKQSASDIHFETFEARLVVRFRIDGVLREVLQPPRVLAPLLISRLKVMAKLDIAEKRLPQDGRIALRIAGRAVDVRVSTIPTNYGERIVLRLLDKQTAPLDLGHLGMAPAILQVMKKLIAKPHGIILVTGPTGSGKTTTLYAALTELNDSSRNILTVEDPIEYYLPGIGQTQVNLKADMTFARGLRAILRQDPDVIMIGEIRDLETAEIAVQSSLTGHLVLSTLHTNSAIGAITRLRDMGVEPFLLSSTLIGVAAQRLVRLLCKNCREARPATVTECDILGIPHENPPLIYHPKGCEQCSFTGYRGRTGIYELIMLDEKLSDMIHDNASEANIEAYARTLYPSMRQDGVRRILAGETSMEEVLRVSTEG
ncbi:MAG: type II secretion system ATPase GspE [Gammaproteobacteria bacterium]